jgi:hypothetical protein
LEWNQCSKGKALAFRAVGLGFEALTTDYIMNNNRPHVELQATFVATIISITFKLVRQADVCPQQ